MNMTLRERERLAYMRGDVGEASTLADAADLQAEQERLQRRVNALTEMLSKQNEQLP